MSSTVGIGFQLTIFGMGLVFVLLTVMALLIKLLLKTDSEKQEVAEEITATPADLDADSLAAIMIAVIMHRAKRRKEAAPSMRQYKPETVHSRWVTVGRSQSNTSWQPDRRTQ